MSDYFTLKTVQMTEKIGLALKTTRTANKVTASALASKIGMSPAYITKLEKGGIHTISGEMFSQICNIITNTDDGIRKVLYTLKQEDADENTILSALNIDSLLVEHSLSKNLVSSIKRTMDKHSITTEQLAEQINRNESIRLEPSYNSMPTNIWIPADENASFSASIKLFVPIEYLTDLLNGEIVTVHRVIIEGILFALYTLAKEPEPRQMAISKLTAEKILGTVINNKITINNDTVDTIFDGIDSDTLDSMRFFITNLKLVSGMSPDNGRKGMKQIKDNFQSDLGFYYAFIRTNITGLKNKSKDQKKHFLKDLRELVEKYADEEDGIDMYD